MLFFVFVALFVVVALVDAGVVVVEVIHSNGFSSARLKQEIVRNI